MHALGVTQQEVMIPAIPREALGPSPDPEHQCIYRAVWDNDRPGPEQPGGESFQGSDVTFAQVRPDLAPSKEAFIVAWAKGYGRVRGFWRVIRHCPGDPIGEGTLIASWQGDLPSSEDAPEPTPPTPLPVPPAEATVGDPRHLYVLGTIALAALVAGAVIYVGTRTP